MSSLSQEEIYDGVVECVAEALRVKPDEVLPDSNVYFHLGAESIDVLDIRFRLEKRFKIKIREGEILESLGDESELEELQKLFTVARTVDFIKAKLENE